MGRLPDGRAVFVPAALPGETARVRLLEEKRGFARAELVEVLTPSPDRIPPRCPHFAACGGCHYQHLPYPLQLQAKQEILREQLERIGRMADPKVEAAVPSPKTWHYRNNVQFHVDPQGKLGFQEPNSNRVLPLSECPVAEEALNEIWPQLEIDPESGIERVSLRLGIGDDILLILEGSRPNAPEFSVEDLPLSAVYTGPEGLILLAGSEYILMEALDRQFKVSAESFFQINRGQAENVVKRLLADLELNGQTVILELYSGAGLFSAFLAPRVGRLIAVESSPSAADDFTVNLDEFDNVELYEAPVEAVLPGLDLRPDIILLDPPRAGLGQKAIEAMLPLKAPVLAYVSCDPATLARDARFLIEGGYTLDQITPFDMFPQTHHIESISFWK